MADVDQTDNVIYFFTNDQHSRVNCNREGSSFALGALGKREGD